MLKMIESTDILMDSMSEHAAAAKVKVAIDFEEAFTLYHRSVFRAAQSVVRDGGLAEDVTQEAFLRFYRHMHTIGDVEMFRPWLIRVALNLARNTVRGNIRANTREDNFVKEFEGTRAGSVEIEFERQCAADDINLALAKVKEPLRSCLVLKQQGLSYREIAEALSLKETSIGTYVARAKQEFLRFYGKREPGESQ